MALVLKNLYSGYFTYIQDKRDTRLDSNFLLGTPWKVITVLTLYWLIVKKFGPKLMKNVEPFDLKILLMIYNIVQVLINGWLTLIGINYLIVLGNKKGGFPWCVETDYSNTEFGVYGAEITYMYLLIKVLDLCDTIFFILRKRYNQVTFLHVYHHIIVCFGAWISVQYVPAGQSTYFGILNSFVHVIMYSYYYLTSQYAELKNSLWWKKYITQLQIVQFAIAIAFYSIPLLSECKFSKAQSLFGIIQNVTMLVMFSNFYHKAYLKKPNKTL